MPRRALVTGASSGIGLAFARVLASDGFDLVLVARTATDLEREAEKLRAQTGRDVRTVPADLTDSASVDLLFETLDGWETGLDVLVNSAGCGAIGACVLADWPELENVIDLNVTAATRVAHECARRMAKDGSGLIINVASTAAFQPGPLMAVYYATKAYVVSFSESLAHELAESGVTVTAVCPGPERTGFQGAAGIEDMRLMRVMPSVGVDRVAEMGWKAARKGRRVVVVGGVNRTMATAARFGPRGLSARIVGWLNAE